MKAEYDLSKMKSKKNPFASQLKQQSVYIEQDVMTYFENMAAETGISYQNLINLYLRSNEFGLGAFATGIMLLTHPERLQQFKDLQVGCAGDHFVSGGYTPYFYFHAGNLVFDTNYIGNADETCGAASGFYPQA